MRNLRTYLGGIAMLALGLCFTACSDDDGPEYSKTVLQNTELKNILVSQGYQFNEQGNLLLDDKANQTTSLDLSGTNISVDALSELSILPNLTDVNLSNNGYGPIFDISKLPAQITGLDLRGNEIYDFEGLVNASVVNDEVQTTILHKLTKLYLPASAKYNVEDLMPFYTQNQAEGTTVDMQMVNSNGALEAYNTLREIPDEYFRAYLKTIMPSIFSTDTQIDISKPLKVDEQGLPIYLLFESDTENINSIEGVEYFINNPYYHSFYVVLTCANHCEVSYLSPRSNIKALWLSNVDTPKGMDLTKATSISRVQFSNNEYLKELDLTNTVIGKQSISDLDLTLASGVTITHCNNLEKISFPSDGKGVVDDIFLGDVPALKSLDLSNFDTIQGFYLFVPNGCLITYPNIKSRFDTGSWKVVELSESAHVQLSVTEDVFNMESTQAFIKTYRSYIEDGYSSTNRRTYGAYKWSKYI